MSLSDCGRQVVFMQTLLRELGEEAGIPTTIIIDNQGANFLANSPAHDKRTKHINI
jgi:hypothetical protein